MTSKNSEKVPEKQPLFMQDKNFFSKRVGKIVFFVAECRTFYRIITFLFTKSWNCGMINKDNHVSVSIIFMKRIIL